MPTKAKTGLAMRSARLLLRTRLAFAGHLTQTKAIMHLMPVQLSTLRARFRHRMTRVAIHWMRLAVRRIRLTTQVRWMIKARMATIRLNRVRCRCIPFTLTSTANTGIDEDGKTAGSCFCRNQGDITIDPLTMCNMLYCPNAAGWFGAYRMGGSEMSSYLSAKATGGVPWPPHGKKINGLLDPTTPASVSATTTTTTGATTSVDTGLVDYGPGETDFNMDSWNLIASIDSDVNSTILATTPGMNNVILTATDDAPPDPMGATDATDALVPLSVPPMDDKEKATKPAKNKASTTGDQSFGPGFTGAWPTAQEERVWWWWEHATLPDATATANGTNATAAASTTAQESASPSSESAAQTQSSTATATKLDKGDDSILSTLLSKLTTKNKAISASATDDADGEGGASKTRQ